MSDLMNKADIAINQNAATAFADFKETLSEKQLEAFEALMTKRGYNGYGKLGEIDFFFPEFKGVVYVRTSERDQGRFVVLAFSGNRSNADVYHNFSSIEKAHLYISEWAEGKITSINKEAERKEKQKSLSKRVREFVNIGDVLYSSWGYEQTNIDYYKVVGFKGQSTLLLQEIGACRIDDNSTYTSAELIPDTEHLIGEVFSKQAKVNQYSDNHPVCIRVTIDQVRSASLKHKEADGSYKPDYYSWGY